MSHIVLSVSANVLTVVLLDTVVFVNQKGSPQKFAQNLIFIWQHLHRKSKHCHLLVVTR